MTEREEQIVGTAWAKKHNGTLIENDYRGCSFENMKDEFTRKELKEAEDILVSCEKDGIKFIPCTSNDFPLPMRKNIEMPAGVFVMGNVSLKKLLGNGTEAFSVVGSRDMSPYGREATEKIVSNISQTCRKPVVVSGLALGIDATAHRASIAYGVPTIAVIPCGLDIVYPLMHRMLAKQIVEKGGVLISQFVPGTAPMAINFILRNRIIAGMSDTTILVESKLKGGAMVTARLAHDYGKKVLAVPGRLDDIRSAGCNQLIKEHVATLYDNL